MKSGDFSADKICLGTAQFGMDYGIANKSGKPTSDTVFEILDYAYGAGICTLDTAPEYGDSEKLIGKYMTVHTAGFKIISKAAIVKEAGDIEKSCKNTLERLNRPSMYGLLLRSTALGKYRDAQKCIEGLKERGLINKIGLSLYKIEELERLLTDKLPFDIIEVPYNIFDQRFSEYFPALRRAGVEVYTRSVFLQGLFFLNEAEIRKSFTWADMAMEKLRSISSEEGIPVNTLCLSFAALNNDIDRIIIGVDSLQQIKENVMSLRSIDRARGIYDELKALSVEDEEILLPYNWK